MDSKCLHETHTHVYMRLCLTDDRLKNLKSSSNKDHSIFHTEVLSGGVTQKQNNGLPFEKRLSQTLKNTHICAYKQLILYRHVTVGYLSFSGYMTVFIISKSVTARARFAVPLVR